MVNCNSIDCGELQKRNITIDNNFYELTNQQLCCYERPSDIHFVYGEHLNVGDGVTYPPNKYYYDDTYSSIFFTTDIPEKGRYIKLKNSGGDLKYTYCQYNYPGGPFNLYDKNNDNLSSSDNYSYNIVTVDGSIDSNETSELSSVLKDNARNYDGNGDIYHDGHCVKYVVNDHDYIENNENEIECTGEWIGFNENDYILESLFEKQLNEISNHDCPSTQEDCMIDPYCIYDNGLCKNMFEYCKYESDGTTDSTITQCNTKNDRCLWSIANMKNDSSPTFNKPINIDDDNRFIQIKNILGNLQSARIGQELTRGSDFYGKAQFGCGVTYENLKKFLHPLRFIDQQPKGKMSKSNLMDVCKITTTDKEFTIYGVDQDNCVPTNDIYFTPDDFDSDPQPDYHTVDNSVCDLSQKLFENSGDTITFYSNLDYDNDDNIDNIDTIGDLTNYRHFSVLRSLFANHMNLISHCDFTQDSCVINKDVFLSRWNEKYCPDNQNYIHGFYGDDSTDCSNQQCHQDHYYKKGYIDKHLELFKNACFSNTGECRYNIDHLIDNGSANDTIDNLCLGNYTYTPPTNGTCILTTKNDNINLNTDSIYSKYNILPFTATINSDGYYTVDIDGSTIDSSTALCSENNGDKQACLRAGNNNRHENTLSEYPDKGNIIGTSPICKYNDNNGECSLNTIMDADKCASIENTYWEVGEGEKCIMSADTLDYPCNGPNEEYYPVVDDNMNPNISYFNKPISETVEEPDKYIIDQNDAYKAYFNLNYDNFCNFDTHFDTDQTITSMCNIPSNKHKCPRNCDNKTSPYQNIGNDDWISAWMIDPNPDKGASAKLHHSLPQGVCINTVTQKEEPYYDSISCNDDNHPERQWYTSNYTDGDNINQYIKSSPYLSSCETVYNSDQFPFTYTYLDGNGTEQNVNYITHNLPTHCPVYDGGNLQYSNNQHFDQNDQYIFGNNQNLYSWSIDGNNNELSTFSGLDTYRYNQKYIYDETVDFSTSDHETDGYCVPGVYYVESPGISPSVDYGATDIGFDDFNDNRNYLCKNIGNKTDCENSPTIFYWGPTWKYEHVSEYNTLFDEDECDGNGCSNHPYNICLDSNDETRVLPLSELGSCNPLNIQVPGGLLEYPDDDDTRCKWIDNTKASHDVSKHINNIKYKYDYSYGNKEYTTSYLDVNKCPHFFTVSENRYPNEPLMECVSENPGTFNPACAQVILNVRDGTDEVLLAAVDEANRIACETQTGCRYRPGKIPNNDNLMNEQNDDGTPQYNNYFSNTCSTLYTSCITDGNCKKCITDEGFENQSTTFNTTDTCYKNVNYRKYYDCMYGLPLQKPGDSSTIKSNLGSAEISGLNHIADEGIWVPFSDHLQEVKDEFNIGNQKEQYGIQNNLNLGEQIYDNYKCKTNEDTGERDRYNSIARLPKESIKSKHIWNVDPTQSNQGYKNYYNNYNTTFYANLENGIILNDNHGNIPHCKIKLSSDNSISYLKNCGVETIRDKISNNDLKPSNIDSGKVEKYIYGKLEGGSLNYFYKTVGDADGDGDRDIQYINDINNRSHVTDGTGIQQTGQFYNYVMDKFGKNLAPNQGILVESDGAGVFTHIPPLASFYTSRGLDNNLFHREWTDVLNSGRNMTCGSVVDFLHSLKHLTDDSGIVNYSIEDKYDDIKDELCKYKEIPIGDNTLNLNVDLINYLKEECSFCVSEKDWKQGNYSFPEDITSLIPPGTTGTIPGECVPKFTDVENRINEKSATPSYDYGTCTGIWTSNDYINFTPVTEIIIDEDKNITTCDSDTSGYSGQYFDCNGTIMYKYVIPTDLAADFIIGIPFYEKYEKNPIIDIPRGSCKYKDQDSDAYSISHICDSSSYSDSSVLKDDIMRICNITNNTQNLYCDSVTNQNGNHIFTRYCEQGFHWDGTNCVDSLKCSNYTNLNSIDNHTENVSHEREIIQGNLLIDSIDPDDLAYSICYIPNGCGHDAGVREPSGVCDCSLASEHTYNGEMAECTPNQCRTDDTTGNNIYNNPDALTVDGNGENICKVGGEDITLSCPTNDGLFNHGCPAADCQFNNMINTNSNLDSILAKLIEKNITPKYNDNLITGIENIPIYNLDEITYECNNHFFYNPGDSPGEDSSGDSSINFPNPLADGNITDETSLSNCTNVFEYIDDNIAGCSECVDQGMNQDLCSTIGGVPDDAKPCFNYEGVEDTNYYKACKFDQRSNNSYYIDEDGKIRECVDNLTVADVNITNSTISFDDFHIHLLNNPQKVTCNSDGSNPQINDNFITLYKSGDGNTFSDCYLDQDLCGTYNTTTHDNNEFSTDRNICVSGTTDGTKKCDSLNTNILEHNYYHISVDGVDDVGGVVVPNQCHEVLFNEYNLTTTDEEVYQCNNGFYQNALCPEDTPADTPCIVKRCLNDDQDFSFVIEDRVGNNVIPVQCNDPDECSNGNITPSQTDLDVNIFGFDIRYDQNINNYVLEDGSNYVEITTNDDDCNTLYCCPSCNDNRGEIFSCGDCPNGYHDHENNIICRENTCEINSGTVSNYNYSDLTFGSEGNVLVPEQTFRISELNTNDFSNVLKCQAGSGRNTEDLNISCQDDGTFYTFTGCETCGYGKYSSSVDNSSTCQDCKIYFGSSEETYSERYSDRSDENKPQCNNETGLPIKNSDDKYNGFCDNDTQTLDITGTDTIGTITNTCVELYSLNVEKISNINPDITSPPGTEPYEKCKRGYTINIDNDTASIICTEIECPNGMYPSGSVDDGFSCLPCNEYTTYTGNFRSFNSNPGYVCEDDSTSYYIGEKTDSFCYADDGSSSVYQTGDNFGKFKYYNQRKHEEKYCSQLSYEDCTSTSRCKYLTGGQCIVNSDYGYETCCRVVENATDDTNYYCRKLGTRAECENEENVRCENRLELYKSECGLMEKVDDDDDLNMKRCNSIKDENDNELCNWDDVNKECIPKENYENMAQLSCKPGYILNHDETGPTYLPHGIDHPNDKIYEHPFCCVNTNTFDNGYEWFDIEEDGTEKCKHGYGFDHGDSRYAGCNRPWLDNSILGYEEEPWLNSTKITCSILGSYDPNDPNDEDSFVNKINEGSSFYKPIEFDQSITGENAFGSNKRIKTISEFLQNDNVFVPSIFYNVIENQDIVSDDVFCKNNYHDDHQYNLHNNCRTTDGSISQTVEITGNIDNDQKCCNGEIDRCSDEEGSTYTLSSVDDEDEYFQKMQSQFPDTGDNKRFRINHRDPYFRRHDVCEKSKCKVPVVNDINYIDTNRGVTIDRDKINKPEVSENIRCNTNINKVSVGGRYLVTLIKTHIEPDKNQEFMKIYVQSENGIPRIINEEQVKQNGLWYKVPIPENVDINKSFSISLPIILVSETGLGDNTNIVEYKKADVLRRFQYPNEEIGQKDIEFIDHPIAICNKHDIEYTYDGCGEFNDTCFDWAQQTDDITIQRIGEDEFYCDSGALIDNTRRILNYDNINEETKKEICCNDQTCSAYECPDKYASISENSNLLIFNDSGIPVPLERCCRKKKCSEWFDEIDTCPPDSQSLDGEKYGYSLNECCFETCGSWNIRTIKEKVKERFNDITDIEIDDIISNSGLFNNNIIENTDEEIISLFHAYEDSGIPEKIVNCSYNQEINILKQGSSELECCFNQTNTCGNKGWECPENMYNNIDYYSETCLNGTSEDRCPETIENQELCCVEYQKCRDMICPYGFINDYGNMDEYCEGPLCNIENDSKCCKEKQKCKELNCGYGKTKNKLRDDYYCQNEKCSIKYDLDTCCSRNELCSDMICPIGYYNKIENDNKSCFDKVCDINNKLDVLKCCVECEPVENAKFYECNNMDGSYAVECNDGYILENGKCLKDKEIIDFTLTFDVDYDQFMNENTNPDIMIKNAICNLLTDKLPFNKCIEKLKINGYERGSLIINFQLESEEINDEDTDEENRRFLMEDVENIFTQGMIVDELNLQIKEKPLIRKHEENKGIESKVKCYSDHYKHECPYGTKIRKKASTINGSSDSECCEIDWEIIKIVGPIFLIAILFIFIIWKTTTRSLIKKVKIIN